MPYMLQSLPVRLESADVFERLYRLQALARLVSDEPLSMQPADDGRIDVVRGERVVGILHDRSLADFLTRGPAVVRKMVEAIGTIYADHRSENGRCRACGQPVPCRTRQVVNAHVTGQRELGK